MIEKVNTFFHNLMVSLNDRYQKEHEQWLKEQRIIQKQQADFINCNIQLQLQAELFAILSQASAPKFLRNLTYPADLLVTGYSTNKTGQLEYYFHWEKSTPYVQPLTPNSLNNIKKWMNVVIYTYMTRLENQCRYDCSLYEHIVMNYPLTVKGFSITNCCNDSENPQNYIRLTVTVNP